MEYLILVFVFGPLGFIFLFLIVNEIRKKTGIDPKYGFAREQDFPQFQKFNDNHKHYTKLAEDKFAEFNKFKEENPFDDAPMRAVK